jgi:hypothetical protein
MKYQKTPYLFRYGVFIRRNEKYAYENENGSRKDK